MPTETDGAEVIDQPWTEVARHVPKISRNHLAATLITTLLSHLIRFERQGFRKGRKARDVSKKNRGEKHTKEAFVNVHVIV